MNTGTRPKPTQPLWRGASVVMIATASASAIALIRDVVVGRHLGFGSSLDAWTVGLASLALLTSAFATSFNSSVVPSLASDQHESGRLASGALTGAVLAGCGVGLFLAALSTPVARLLAADPSSESDLATVLFVLAAAVPLVLLRAAATAILHTSSRFAAPAASPVIPAVAVLAGVQLMVAARLTGMAVLHTVGLLVEAVLLVALASSVVPLTGVRLGDARYAVKAIGRHTTIAFGAAALASANPVVDAWFAGRKGEGRAGELLLSGRIPIAIAGLLSIAVATPAFPRFVSRYRSGGDQALGAEVRRVLRTSLVGSVAVAGALAAICRPLARLLYEGGEIAAAGAASIGDLQLTYTATIPPYVATVLLHRAFHASRREALTLAVSSVGLVVNAIGNAVLGAAFGLHGIALSTAIVYTVSAGMLAFWIRSRRHPAVATAKML